MSRHAPRPLDSGKDPDALGCELITSTSFNGNPKGSNAVAFRIAVKRLIHNPLCDCVCFDSKAKSTIEKLPVKYRQAAAEAGSIPVVAYPKDYKQVDGIMIAHRIRMEMMEQDRLVTVKTITQNVDLPAKHFDPPDEVKDLIK